MAIRTPVWLLFTAVFSCEAGSVSDDTELLQTREVLETRSGLDVITQTVGKLQLAATVKLVQDVEHILSTDVMQEQMRSKAETFRKLSEEVDGVDPAKILSGHKDDHTHQAYGAAVKGGEALKESMLSLLEHKTMKRWLPRDMQDKAKSALQTSMDPADMAKSLEELRSDLHDGPGGKKIREIIDKRIDDALNGVKSLSLKFAEKKVQEHVSRHEASLLQTEVQDNDPKDAPNYVSLGNDNGPWDVMHPDMIEKAKENKFYLDDRVRVITNPKEMYFNANKVIELREFKQCIAEQTESQKDGQEIMRLAQFQIKECGWKIQDLGYLPDHVWRTFSQMVFDLRLEFNFRNTGIKVSISPMDMIFLTLQVANDIRQEAPYYIADHPGKIIEAKFAGHMNSATNDMRVEGAKMSMDLAVQHPVAPNFQLGYAYTETECPYRVRQWGLHTVMRPADYLEAQWLHETVGACIDWEITTTKTLWKRDWKKTTRLCVGGRFSQNMLDLSPINNKPSRGVLQVCLYSETTGDVRANTEMTEDDRWPIGYNFCFNFGEDYWQAMYGALEGLQFQSVSLWYIYHKHPFRNMVNDAYIRLMNPDGHCENVKKRTDAGGFIRDDLQERDDFQKLYMRMMSVQSYKKNTLDYIKVHALMMPPQLLF